jgi:uncharacterized protein with PIN domain
VLPDELNATKNCVHCNGSLAEVSGEFNVEFIGFLSSLTARNATFVEEQSVKSPEIPHRSSCVVLPGELNAIKNCIRCNGGLAKMSGKVNVEFIYFLSPFDRTQRHVCGGRVGQVI